MTLQSLTLSSLMLVESFLPHMYLKEPDSLLECSLWGCVIILRGNLLIPFFRVAGGISLPLEHEACPPIFVVLFVSRPDRSSFRALLQFHKCSAGTYLASCWASYCLPYVMLLCIGSSLQPPVVGFLYLDHQRLHEKKDQTARQGTRDHCLLSILQ